MGYYRMMAQEWNDPGFWIALAAGLVCLGFVVTWLATGARRRRRKVAD